MKQLLLLLAVAAVLSYPTRAQTVDTAARPGQAARQPVSPTIRAARQLNLLQKKLTLNQDQVVKLRMILLDFNVSLDSLRSHPSGDRKADNRTRRALAHEADVKTYALLTTGQQVIYTQWKQQEETRRRLNRAARMGNSADSTQPRNPPQSN